MDETSRVPRADDPIVVTAPTIQTDGTAAVPSPEVVASAAVTAEQVAGAVDGSLASKLRAKHAEMLRGTKEFPVPGWDGDLVLEAQVVRDRKQLADGLTNEQLILQATVRVLYVDSGERQEIQGGWAGVGRLMGIDGGDVTLGQIVRAVLDNPLRLDGFAELLISWMMGRRSAVEAVLGG